jgi:TatD DNase family protein
MLVDVHCHLEMIKDLEGALKRAKEAGIVAVITAGTDEKTNTQTLDLAKRHTIVQASLGFYPDQAKHRPDITMIRNHKDDIVAIGECGMDFKTDDNIIEQQDLFTKHIELTKELGLPIIVHSRKAETECLDLLEKHGAKKVVMHCFDGNKQQIERAVRLGYYLTATPNIIRANQVQMRIRMTPLKQLLTETDAPFMGPEKDKQNEPANVAVAIGEIAKIKQIDKTECANIIYMNYRRLF